MNLKPDYKRLYQHWLKEFEQTALTRLTQEDFNYFSKIVNHIKKFELENKQKVKLQLLNSYKENFNFLFTDFLKIRELKLLNAALTLQEIDFNDVIEAEKLFYQNLISSLKGFKKLKKISLYDDNESLELEEIFEKEIVIVDPTPVEKVKDDEKIIIPIDDISEKSKTIQTKQLAQYKYTLIRFTSPSPPLVGIDGINYGPFQEDDIANLPYKNAKILIYEKFAEKIDIT
jgi:DNA replication initiation complex subunit (GINS family)